MEEENSPSEVEPIGQQPTEESDRLAQPVDVEQPPRLAFPVVGIGASAGGLEAFGEFFKAMTPESGMAFIIVQHLTPDRESMIADILSRYTKMPVQQVEDGMRIEVNHVYIIRPGYTLTIKNGALHLGERVEKPGHSRPVDDFFKSLAEEQRERAISIIMSGMGSNGTAGCQAIKAVGGLCIAQDPGTAQFPSMPRHLIDAGYSDYILRAADMPDVLLGYAGHPYASGREGDAQTVLRQEKQHVHEILAVLRTRTRQDFSGYKKPTVLRRIQRRMGLNRVTDIGEYAKILRQSPTEVTALADDLLIHVTGFFRDAEYWEAFRARVIVPLIAAREPESSIRCWVTACSSGEEAFTLAILLVEEAERISKHLDIKVFATDMAERSLQNARNGVYPGGIEAEIVPPRLARFFQKEDAVYRVRADLRKLVVFAPQNVLQDPPFSRLDIITCRNLLIYLEPDVQHRVLELMHFGLREGGALFLGTSETVGGAEDLFEPIDKKSRIFRRIGPTRRGTVQFPLPRAIASHFSERPRHEMRAGARPSLGQLITKALLEEHTPPAITIDRDNRIVYFHGDTDPFLSQPRGDATRDLFSMARESLRGAIRTVLHRASSANAPATVLDGWMEIEPGRRHRIAVSASPLDPKGAPDYFVVSFQDRGAEPGAAPASPGVARDDVENELKRIDEELQGTIEELQTRNEELKASNEEVMSMNEELQSTNEELETSREEMQSLNEELSTVNSQLQSKMEEQQSTSNDLKSLLTSTDIAVLFLDTHFRIRRFTPAVRNLLEMIASDVGRPLGDLAKKFTDPNLLDDAAAVLERLVPIEREVAAEDNRWYIRRALPYRTSDNRIAGVVLTFVDITERKHAEEALRESEASFRTVVDLVPDLLWRNNADCQTSWHNRRWSSFTGQSPAAAQGSGWLDAIHADDRVQFCAHLKDPSTGAHPVRQEYRIRGIDGNYRWFLFQAQPMRDPKTGAVIEWFGAATDIHEQRTALEALRESEQQFRLLVEGVRDFAMFMLDSENRIATWNRAAERLLGYTESEVVGQSAAIIFTAEDRAHGVPQKERAEAVGHGESVGERWYVAKDGRRFWGRGALSSVPGSGGQPNRFVKVLRDETVRKVAEDLLQGSADAAEAANRMKDEFLATLSHELRTPLAAILLWIKILRENKADPEQAKAGLQAIESSAEAQKHLIQDLLDTSRITSGKLRVAPVEVDLASVVHDAIDTILPAANAREVVVEAQLGSEVGIVRADPERLRQVVWNLLTNAVKFTDAGGKVTVIMKRLDGGVEIRVTDTGRGIEAEFLPHVFDRFRQADASITRAQGGLGLGLSIAKQLVELHGGTIEAQSAGRNKGATFIIRLPLPQVRGAKPGGAATKSVKPSAVPIVGKLAGVRVLLVEDIRETRDALAILLRQAGTHVTVVESTAGALAEFRKSRPDVIISDIGLPGEDGLSLMRRIRAQESEQGLNPVPAVALSAFVRDEDRRSAMDAGFQQHVAKPVVMDHLLTVLQELAKVTAT
jgi:two-component system CheB/CheR fusion protein